MKGKSHFLVRTPKPTKAQVKMNKLEEEKKEAYTKATLIQRDLDSLKLKIKEFEFNQREADMNADKLSKLYDLGLIDENGDPINNSMS